MGNSFSLCPSPWSSDTCSQSCRYPQVPESCWKQWEFNSSAQWVRRGFWSEMILQERMEREGLSTRHCRDLCDGRHGRGVPCRAVFSAQVLGGSRVPNVGSPKVGKAKLDSGRYRRHVCHLMAPAGVRSNKEPAQSGLVPKVSGGWISTVSSLLFELLCCAGSWQELLQAAADRESWQWNHFANSAEGRSCHVSNPPTPQH